MTRFPHLVPNQSIEIASQKVDPLTRTVVTWLTKTLSMNGGVHPDTSHPRICWAAQLIMLHLEDVTFSISLRNVGRSRMAPLWLPRLTNTVNAVLSAADYQDVLSIIQNTSVRFVASERKERIENYIQLLRQTKQQVFAQRVEGFTERQKKEKEILDQVLYLIHEAFAGQYLQKYGEMYSTPEEQARLAEAIERTKNTKIS